MKDNIYKSLACPECGSDLEFDSNKECSCKACSRTYPIQSETLNFLSDAREIADIDDIRSTTKYHDILRKIFIAVKPSSTFKTKKNKSRISNLLNAIEHNEVSVNIGSGNTNYSQEIINIDIEANDNVDIIADRHK